MTTGMMTDRGMMTGGMNSMPMGMGMNMPAIGGGMMGMPMMIRVSRIEPTLYPRRLPRRGSKPLFDRSFHGVVPPVNAPNARFHQGNSGA